MSVTQPDTTPAVRIGPAFDGEPSVSSLPKLFAGPVPFSVYLSIVFLAAIVLAGAFAPMLAPWGYDSQDLAARLQGPGILGGSSQHLLGTDELGRDILTRLLFAIRTSLVTALVGTLIAALIGTALGSTAALRKGIVGEALMMLADVQASIPFLLFAIAVLGFAGSSMPVLMIIIGLNGWDTYARLARGLVLAAAEEPYVEASRLIGASRLRTFLRDILPNILGVLVVQMTLNFPGAILLESGLSFLGIGVQPPLTSLGLMVGAGREYLLYAWWMSVFPGLVLLATTMSVSLLGDWLRDRLDPRLAGQ